jgi:ureidoacrylate peracid hydrolase
MLNYKVFFVADGNATFTDEEHNATLSAMAYTFCDVIESEALIELIEQNQGERGIGLAAE